MKLKACVNITKRQLYKKSGAFFFSFYTAVEATRQPPDEKEDESIKPQKLKVGTR